MPTWKVVKFRRESGECPVDDWLASREVAPRDRAAIDSRMRIIEQVEQLPAGWVVDYQTTELQRLERKCPGNKAVRFLCHRDDETKTIILLNGMVKKSKALPPEKIREAEQVLAEYLRGDGSVEDF